jgi:hypothetical protein
MHATPVNLRSHVQLSLVTLLVLACLLQLNHLAFTWRPTHAHADGTISVFVGVLSRTNRSEARQAVRQTWGGDPRLARVMFFTLRPPTTASWAQLQREAAQHGDIVVTGEVVEGYTNITHSTLSLLRTSMALPGCTHVFKTDDDVYVRVGMLLQQLQQLPREWLLAGFPHQKTRQPPYVPFGFGWGWAVSANIARLIAAGGPHLVPEPGSLFFKEDHQVGYWVAALAAGANASVTVGGSPWRLYAGHVACNASDVVTHLSGAWEPLYCMHRRGGECCTVA